jgi:peptidoglycan/xylan/chitin deacetylase (PgdA/CDA1 family)
MGPDIAAIWRRPPADRDVRLTQSLRSAFDRAKIRQPVRVFFRADDVAVPGVNFNRMMALFAKYGAPLSLAVVPAWLTPERWAYLKGFEKDNPSRWCWHQHGWRHANHEVTGKKQEFGETRSAADITQDLTRGKLRLEQIMTEAFYPVFTPPWNRCSARTLQALKELGYAGVSRSRGSRPLSTKGLPDYYVNVDLHTRKEKDPASGWHNLMTEFEQAGASGFCGIMIHHQLMNTAAFEFLEVLLKVLTSHPGIRFFNFRDLGFSWSFAFTKL